MDKVEEGTSIWREGYFMLQRLLDKSMPTSDTPRMARLERNIA